MSSSLKRACEGVQSSDVTLYLITGGVLVTCFAIAVPFLPALIGAITLAVITQRPFEWLEAKCGRSGLAAAISVALVTLCIVAPAFFLLQELSKQALLGATLLRDGVPQLQLEELLRNHPAMAARWDYFSGQVNLEQTTRGLAGYVFAHLGAGIANSFSVLTQLVLMIVMLFFLYRDRIVAVNALRSILPLSSDESDLLLDKVRDTLYTTTLARIAIATAQGILAGAAFWVLGVDGSLLWAVMTVLAALIPAVGAFLVWVPISIYLALSGHWVQASLLAGWGALVVSTVDNLLFPALVGARLAQHTVIVLVSVLGGIALFGISGLIMGPVLLTVAMALLDIWSHRRKQIELLA
jgi:predicted PurR-regulated permease PerM